MSEEITTIKIDSAEEELTQLKEFVLDISCLNSLNKWTNKFNIFDVLKISKTEIRHSNILAWIMDPNENHKMGDLVIKGIIELLVKKQAVSLDVFKILLMNFYDFKVLREWNGIDILLFSEESKIVICIENKVFAQEHGNQLYRYKKVITKYFENYGAIYIFLTPNGDDASDTENWVSFNYSDIINILNESMEKTPLFDDVSLLLKNYIETVRWHIMKDERLIEICNEIYRKHKKALDLIYEYKFDNIQEIAVFIKESALIEFEKKDMLTIDKGKPAKRIIRFTTNKFSSLLNNTMVKDGWGSNNHFYYEIYNYNNLSLKLTISRGDFDYEDSLSYFEKIITALNIQNLKPDWQWKTVKSWNILRYSEDNSLEDIQDKLLASINSTLEKVFEWEKALADKIEKI